MPKTAHYILACAMWVMTHTSLYAKTDFGQSGDYLRYGAGARALGMGGAFTAVSDDVSADYWNPAGLAFLDEYQCQTMYAPLPADSNLFYLAFGAPLGPKWGTLAVSDVMLRTAGFQGRDDLNLGNGDGVVSDNAFSISYGKGFMDRWSVGGRGRFLQQTVLSDSANTFALDLSGYLRPWHGISAGLTLNNLNRPSMTLHEDPEVFRPYYRGGLAFHWPRELFILAVDATKTESQSLYYTAGVEYNPTSVLSVRGGWDQSQRVTAGMGVSLRSLRFDYAFSNEQDLGASNKVALTFRWGNIYRAQISPEGLAKNTDAIYIEGLRNEVKFKVDVPKLKIDQWTLILSDEEGRPVRSLTQQYHPGQWILWDMTDDNGRPVKRGSYRYRFAVEYKSGKLWEERGHFRLDYKTNGVPDVEIRLRTPEGLEGTDSAPAGAPVSAPVEGARPVGESTPTP